MGQVGHIPFANWYYIFLSCPIGDKPLILECLNVYLPINISGKEGRKKTLLYLFLCPFSDEPILDEDNLITRSLYLYNSKFKRNYFGLWYWPFSIIVQFLYQIIQQTTVPINPRNSSFLYDCSILFSSSKLVQRPRKSLPYIFTISLQIDERNVAMFLQTFDCHHKFPETPDQSAITVISK